MTPAERWQRIVTLPESEVDLAEAALVIAAEEYPDLDIVAYLSRIDEMGANLRKRLRPDITATEKLIALNHYVFGELGFAGNAEEYYDPRNSLLNDVIDRRLGIPITLSVIYMEIGRRAGLALHGVSFPGHFLVKCVVRDGAIVLDPYANGASLGVEDLQRLLKTLGGSIATDTEAVKGMLSAAGAKEILARMLRNLKGVYLQQRDLLRALSAVERIIALAPAAAEEYRDRGQIYLDLECFRAALADFRHYLERRPEARDAAAVRQRVAELQPVVARLN
ncbi:MAG: tetratricopeptide repeat protein [Burkholderiales bacterium]|nr:tetratricopeptide repeat protein [Burkholderiales bacterium]